MENLRKWRYYLQDLESPDIFIDYTLLWAVSSALQRRVFFGHPKQPLFPNVYFVFVAPPGVGKSMAARKAGDGILKSFVTPDTKVVDSTTGQPVLRPDISFAADCTSPQSLIMQLSMSQRAFAQTKILENGSMIKVPASHNSMSMLLSEELTTMFRENMELICSSLNQWYDAQDFNYTILQRGEQIITNVCVSMLGCSTPDNIMKLTNRGILDQGLNSRAIFIYASEARQKKLLFDVNPEQEKAFDDVRTHVKSLLKIEGQCKLADDAVEWFKDYYESGKLEKEILNKDKRVENYRARIKVHAIKNAILCHYIDHTDMVITLKDLQNGVSMLRRVEPEMHKALASSSKNELYDIGLRILDFIKSSGGKVSRIAIKLKFECDVPMEDIEKVLVYLKETYRIEEKSLPEGIRICIKEEAA
jgi:hypothetical protein